MQHVADGIMHAYLDGALDALADAGELPGGATGADVRAHFDACADCRARLDDARAVKERAGHILDDAGRGVVDVPPFELIGGRPRPRRRASWLPLAWAASVVLAIGAGWWASDIARDERVTVASEMTRAAPSAGVATDDVDSAADVPAEPERAGQLVDAQAEVQTSDEQTSDVMVAEAASDAPVVVPTPVAPAVASSSMADMAVAPLAGGDAGVGSASAAAGAAATERMEAERMHAARMQAGPAAHPDLDAFRAQLAAARADSSAWRRIDGAAAGAVGEQRAVLVVAGAGAAIYDVTAPTIGLGELVRVRQRLESGEQIEVITARPRRVALDEIVVTGSGNPAAAQRPTASAAAQRLAAAAAAARPLNAPSREPADGDAGDGRARVDVVSSELLGGGIAEVTVWRPDDGIWVAVRGALPAAELVEMARRLVRPQG